MPRRRAPKDLERLEILASGVRDRYLGTPLQAVGSKLEANLLIAAYGAQSGAVEHPRAFALADVVERILRLLPQSFGDRFLFDAALIQAITEEWERGRARFSRMIMPRHGSNEWGYRGVPLPSEDRSAAHLVKVIHFPGDDRADQIDLLEYPFLLHELGHDLLGRPECGFMETFSTELTRIIGRLRMRAVSDRGPAKIKSQSILERLDGYWTPVADQHNWAHEVAVDVIGLWSCGPAYLDNFRRALDERKPEPYQMVVGHPPYALRTAVLIDKGEKLGWRTQAAALRVIAEAWGREKFRFRKDNTYAALTDANVVKACVGRALAACGDLGIPPCDGARIERVSRDLDGGREADFGSDLILAAWVVANRDGTDALSRWEEKVIPALIGSLRD